MRLAQDREFWLLHYSGWAAITLYYLVASVFIQLPVLPTLLGLVIYMLFSTLYCAVLIQLYTVNSWYNMAIRKQILWVLLLALPVGLLFGLLLAKAVIALGIDTFGGFYAGFGELGAGTRFAIIASNNGLMFGIVIILWSLIYIGVFSYKSAQAAELRAAHAQRDLKEAKVNALAGQLRPHFLFNALNNIQFVMSENVPKAQEMLVNLSEILQYSLHNEERGKVSLQEELSIVDSFIGVLRLQFEHKLNFQVTLDPACLPYQVPPMMIQLLVENAVKHGLDNHYNEGHISLSIELVGESLRVEVRNDTSEQVGDKFDSRKGVGIKNIKSRLQLLYGAEASFDIEQNGVWVVATLTLPLEQTL